MVEPKVQAITTARTKLLVIAELLVRAVASDASPKHWDAGEDA
jgi:hypothetical protein